MTRRPPSQRPRHLLKGTARQCSPRLLHARFQGANLEFPGPDVCRDIEFTRGGERGVGRLDGEGAGIAGFGTLPRSCRVILSCGGNAFAF